jgi:oligopeptide/dipeptide ABC transporter ATP-binding protein
MTQTTSAVVSSEKRLPPVLRAERLTKHFASGGVLERLAGKRSVVHAVEDVDLTVGTGETLGIVGESGCGKSTLGRMLLRLYRPTGGRVFYGDRDITETAESKLRPLRRRMQMIFQDPKGSLNPRLTVHQSLRRALQVHGVKGSAAEERILQCLRDAGLDPDRFRDRYPAQLSGGEAQRVGIARALLLDPEIIVADEPVSSLDVTVQAQIVNLLARLRESQGLSMIFISHDMAVVRHLSDRVMVMYLGRVMEEGPADKIFGDPLHPYTKALLAAVPSEGTGGRPVGLKGAIPSPLDPPPGCPFQTRCPAKLGPICESERPGLAETDDGRRVACHIYPESTAAGVRRDEQVLA